MIQILEKKMSQEQMSSSPDRALNWGNPFRPEWRGRLMLEGESTDTPPSSQTSMPTLGKRGRVDSDALSTELPLKNIRLNNNMFHSKYSDWFIPTYIANRIPLPIDMLSHIYNIYLDAKDREVLEGDIKLLTSTTTRNIPIYRLHFWPATLNTFYIAEGEIFDKNPNSP
nr:MAG: hypothetical protein [Cressdnaviricota sp.]